MILMWVNVYVGPMLSLPEQFSASVESSSLVSSATWKKYTVMGSVMERLRVRDKRHIFQMIRLHPNVSHDTFFPAYGFTVGEFSVWQVLSDNVRRNRDR